MLSRDSVSLTRQSCSCSSSWALCQEDTRALLQAKFSNMAESTENDESPRDAVVSPPRTISGQVPCLFFGRCGCVLQLKSKGGHPTKTHIYHIGELMCCALEDNLKAVSCNLGVPYDTSQICQLPCGYVHVYGPKCPLSCSSVNLTQASAFFKFETAETKVTLPQTSTIDVKPFDYSNADLLYLDSGNKEVMDTVQAKQKNTKYVWLATPDHPWVWPESVWVERLLHCLQGSSVLKGLEVVPAFRWWPKTYRVEVSILFPNVGSTVRRTLPGDD